MKVQYVLLLFGHLYLVPVVLLGQTEPPSADKKAYPNEITIDSEVTLFTNESGIGHTMLQMERHPDGTIYVNGHASGLFKSTDEGENWQRIRWKYNPGGFGISQDGRIWLITSTTRPAKSVIRICQSADGGKTWQEQSLDCGPLAEGGARDPYNAATPEDAYTNFLERPDGTWMFSCSMRYRDWDDWLSEDPTRPGLGDVMVRTTDGGKTWGDPTIVHRHCTETEFATDPQDPDHILAASRIQRGLLPGEDKASAVCSFGWEYKNALLLDSTDGGRTFRVVPDSMTRCYGHRATILWTEQNVVVVTRQHGCETPQERAAMGRSGGWLVVNISMDGGQTWITDAGATTTAFYKAREFTLVPPRVGHGFTAPTVQLTANRFLTVYAAGPDPSLTNTIRGVRWYLGGR